MREMFLTIFQTPCLDGDFPVLSLQLLGDKQHLGGEDCNVSNFSSINWDINFCLNSFRR